MSGSGEFLSGIALSRSLHAVVAPLLAERFPSLPYASALVGPGSEVLGFDTSRSTDHDWGPRLTLFLHPGDVEQCGEAISDALSRHLPRSVRGWPTNFIRSGADQSSMPEPTEGPVDHRIDITDLGAWLTDRLGSDAALGGEPDLLDWLSMPQQRLAEVTGGAVFHDGLGLLRPVRDRLTWYPEPVWRYLLACQWAKLSQEEPFVARAAEVGDELGSAVVAARQVREAMRLALLMARRYAPYSKWLGTAFTRRVPDAAELADPMRVALAATGIAVREAALCEVYEALARRHNSLGLTAPLDPGRRRFFTRPFAVLDAGRFTAALYASITDPRIRSLPLIGAVDQWADNTDLLDRVEALRGFAGDAWQCV
jgi:hypothetical protein